MTNAAFTSFHLFLSMYLLLVVHRGLIMALPRPIQPVFSFALSNERSSGHASSAMPSLRHPDSDLSVGGRFPHQRDLSLSTAVTNGAC